MDNLDFEFQRKEWVKLLGDDNGIAEAKRIHSLVVHDALRDAYLAIGSLAPQLKQKEARYFLLYGAARRLRMMFSSYRELVSRVAIDGLNRYPKMMWAPSVAI